MADHVNVGGDPAKVFSYPRRVHFSRFDGVALPTGTKLITRPGRYGNPYKISDHGSDTAVVTLFRTFLAERRNPPPVWVNPHPTYPSDDQIRENLAGYDLACTCQAGHICHGDPLLEVANGLPGTAGG